MNDKVKITNLIKKSDEWYEVNLQKTDGTLIGASLNRTTKKGVPFPNFDTLAVGQEVEGRLWQSQAGKWYLFPPEQEKSRGGANSADKSQVIEKAQDRKNEFIGKTLDRKEESIKLAGAQRDAVLIVVAQINKGETQWTDSSIESEIVKWRNWFLLSDEMNNPPPFE